MHVIIVSKGSSQLQQGGIGVYVGDWVGSPWEGYDDADVLLCQWQILGHPIFVVKDHDSDLVAFLFCNHSTPMNCFVCGLEVSEVRKTYACHFVARLGYVSRM